MFVSPLWFLRGETKASRCVRGVVAANRLGKTEVQLLVGFGLPDFQMPAISFLPGGGCRWKARRWRAVSGSLWLALNWFVFFTVRREGAALVREAWERLFVVWPLLRGEQWCTFEAPWRLPREPLGCCSCCHRPGSG